MTYNQRPRDIFPHADRVALSVDPFKALLHQGLSGPKAAVIPREPEPAPAYERTAQEVMFLQHDITILKENQTALEKAYEAAESASREKSTLLANMKHEISAPVNGVVGIADLLSKSPLTEEQKRFVETIRASGQALLATINNILDKTDKKNSGTAPILQYFDFERLIHEVVTLLQPQARSKKLDLVVDYDMFLPTSFMADSTRIRQVLTNLIDNAIKRTARGHILVRVVGIEEGYSQLLHITIEDTSDCITAEVVERISQSLEQNDGLNLGLSHELVTQMDGEIWVAKTQINGMCFGFKLSVPRSAEDAPDFTPIHVQTALVVDSTIINRAIIERQLAPYGVSATFATSFEEAFDILSEPHVFDVIIANHADEKSENGIDFTRKIRIQGVDTPVILLSDMTFALNQETDGLGTISTLVKPLLRADLYRNLQTIPPAVIAQPEICQAVIEEQAADGRLMRILVAEDNHTNQLIFSKLLKDAAVSITFANTGREAISLFESTKPDMVFMDTSLPDMDGEEVALKIRSFGQHGQNTPIVAITAFSSETQADAPSQMVDAKMNKPLRKSVLLELIEKYRPQEASQLNGAED